MCTLTHTQSWEPLSFLMDKTQCTYVKAFYDIIQQSWARQAKEELKFEQLFMFFWINVLFFLMCPSEVKRGCEGAELSKEGQSYKSNYLNIELFDISEEMWGEKHLQQGWHCALERNSTFCFLVMPVGPFSQQLPTHTMSSRFMISSDSHRLITTLYSLWGHGFPLCPLQSYLLSDLFKVTMGRAELNDWPSWRRCYPAMKRTIFRWAKYWNNVQINKRKQGDNPCWTDSRCKLIVMTNG